MLVGSNSKITERIRDKFNRLFFVFTKRYWEKLAFVYTCII